MPTPIHREQVRDLIDRGAQLVEVLDRDEYEQFHLPGAVHIPLKELGSRALAELDPHRPVVTYCWDARCDLSTRAAHRLETLGFEEVYDYVASKVDWTGAGLPIQGRETKVTHLGDLADATVPVCRWGEPAAFGDWDVCVVVNEANVVVALAHRDGDLREGPPTYRPDVTAEEMAERLAKHPEPRVLVTNADGTLVGIAMPDVIERAAKAARP